MIYYKTKLTAKFFELETFFSLKTMDEKFKEVIAQETLKVNNGLADTDLNALRNKLTINQSYY